MLARFGLGWRPRAGTAWRSGWWPRFGVAALLEAGLVLRRERGEAVYDRFRDRLIVPLRLAVGQAIGFGGRALGDESPST